MRLQSNNGGLFNEPTILVSTVSLPAQINNAWFETCIFDIATGNSEIISRYDEMSSAIKGHFEISKSLGAIK